MPLQLKLGEKVLGMIGFGARIIPQKLAEVRSKKLWFAAVELGFACRKSCRG